MESSSNDSFAWTEASDSSTDSVEMPIDTKGIGQNYSDNDSEYGKKYKRKLHKELFANHIEQQKVKKRKISNERREVEYSESQKKKKIKLELESDSEICKNKCKISENNELQSSDENYLQMRVKEEMDSKMETDIILKQNKKVKSNDTKISLENIGFDLYNVNGEKLENNDDKSSFDVSNLHQNTDSEVSFENSRKKKKKKVKRRKKMSDAEEEKDYVNIEDKQMLEDSVVESCHVYKNHGDDELLDAATKERSNNNNRSNNCNSHVNVHINAINKQTDSEAESKTLESNVISDNDQGQSVLKYGRKSIEVNSKRIPVKITSRISRISDRIRFEDENDLGDDIRYSDKNIELETKKLDKFVKAHEHLKPISRKFNQESNITDDDDIWVVKCPHNINIESFQDITIALDKKCKMKIDGSTYEGNFENNTSSITVLSQMHSQFVFRNISSCGTLNICKRVPKLHIRYDTVMLNNERNFVPLPETKVRHPLFGSNYKKAIKLTPSIKERLTAKNEQNTSNELNTKRKVKKHKKDIKNNDSELVCSDDHKSEETVIKKENKKRKHKLEEQFQIKKGKLKKSHSDSADVWDSEKAIEENLFNF